MRSLEVYRRKDLIYFTGCDWRNTKVVIQVHWKCQGKTSQGIMSLTYAGFGLVHVVGKSCTGNVFWDTVRPAADLVELEQTLRKNGGDITEVTL